MKRIENSELNKQNNDMASFNDLGYCTRQESEQFTSANILEVTVATNGYQGGDSGHGSRTYFSLEDLGSTDMDVRADRGKVEIMLGGDCELQTFIDALRWAADRLEEMSKEG